MPDFTQIEQDVDQYVQQWAPYRPNANCLIMANNDFGFENLQVFANGCDLGTYTHSDLCKLLTLVTRSLNGQINLDHFRAWSWCAQLLSFPSVFASNGAQSAVIQDAEWCSTFQSLTHLLLAECQSDGNDANHHARVAIDEKYVISGPMSFAILEGLLRRKTPTHVNTDGTIHQSFSVTDSQGNPQNYNGRLNRINVGLRLFEQIVCQQRGRQCDQLSEICNEIASIHPPSAGRDVYDVIDLWRNILVHGQLYWQNRVPLIMNLLCLLVIDEIEPSSYNDSIEEINKEIERSSESGRRMNTSVFPPHILPRRTRSRGPRGFWKQ